MKPGDNSQKTIIFISNRFGYGPTITLLHIIREFATKTKLDLIFAGSGICKEAFDQTLADRVSFVETDERNEDMIANLLLKYKDNPGVFVVSCLNRLAIQAANKLSIPNAMIDFLTWMWKEIPPGFEYANHYFSNHFGTKNKRDNMIETPLILGPIPKMENFKKKYLLINIGGTQTHLVPGLPENYLTLLSSLLNKIKTPANLEVVVAGGSQAMGFLKSLNQRPEFRIESLSSSEYISIQRQSKKILSLAGTNSTFMSFVIGLPVVFLLPQLYAHWKLTLFLKERGYITDCEHWDKYLSLTKDINNLSEKESIFFIEDLAKQALGNHEIFNVILSDLQNMIDAEVDTTGQDQFIKDFGVNGEKYVFDYLKKVWNI